MRIVNKEEVGRIIAEKRAGIFATAINKLEPGQALSISIEEFKQHYSTPIPLFFHSKFNRGRKLISCQRVGDTYFVIKL